MRGARVAPAVLEVIFLCATVAFLVWVHRATANLQALGAPEDRLTPASAVALCVIPLINVGATPWVLHTLWVESGWVAPPRWRTRGLVLGWAAAIAVSGFCASNAEILRRRSSVLEERWLVWSALAIALWLAAAVACLAITRAVQRRQDEHWLDLERRRAIPHPSADRLR
jgi:hypothetical protein